MTFERFDPSHATWGTADVPQGVTIPDARDARLRIARAAIDDLNCLPRPDSISEMRWFELLKDLHHVADNWLDISLACGWALHDLFGSSIRLAGRVDLMGVAILLRGRPIESIDENRMVIVNRNGPSNVFYRHAPGVSQPFDRSRGELIWNVIMKGKNHDCR